MFDARSLGRFFWSLTWWFLAPLLFPPPLLFKTRSFTYPNWLTFGPTRYEKTSRVSLAVALRPRQPADSKQGFCSQFSRAKSQQAQHSLRKQFSPHWVIQLWIQTLSKEAGEEGGGSVCVCVWGAGGVCFYLPCQLLYLFLPKIRGGAGPGPEPSPHAIVNR